MIPKGLSVTLVEPHYPVNLGHTARLMKNFGVDELYLVKPKVDMSVAAVYASHASGVLDDARVAAFKDVRKKHQLLIATTAVRARRKSNVIRKMVAPEKLRPLIEAASSASLVFGRDTTGLTNEEIAECDVTTTIDTSPSYRALNLGHAVAILLYVVSQPSRKKLPSQSRVARRVFASSFFELAEASLVQRHKIENLEKTGNRLAAVSGLSDRQLQMMTGVFRRAVLRMRELQPADSKT